MTHKSRVSYFNLRAYEAGLSQKWILNNFQKENKPYENRGWLTTHERNGMNSKYSENTIRKRINSKDNGLSEPYLRRLLPKMTLCACLPPKTPEKCSVLGTKTPLRSSLSSPSSLPSSEYPACSSRMSL